MCEDVLPAALAGDLDGHFERLVMTYQDRIYAFALRLAAPPRPQEAEEMAQDVFVRAYGALARYPAERVRTLALRPWLYQIALNVARNRARGRRPRLLFLDGETPVAEPAAARDEGPEARLEQAERRDELAAGLAALPARYREALLLRHVAGLGYGEAAAALGRPVGSVKSDVHRGIQMLRRSLERDEKVERPISIRSGAR